MISTTPTPGDLRAQIARERLYFVAAELRWHPSTLSLYLNERRPLPRELAQRIAEAIDRVSGRARAGSEA